MPERIAALSSLISSLSPHVVALQEVTPTSHSLLSSSSWYPLYHTSPPPSPPSPYYTLLFSLIPPASSYRIPFISQMGRDLTVAALDVHTTQGGRRVVVGTSHLESLWQSRDRRAQQLKQALGTLVDIGGAGGGAAGGAGGDGQRAGDGAAGAAGDAPPVSLVLMGDLNLKANEGSTLITGASFTDVWPQCWQTDDSNDRVGFTMDYTKNAMIATSKLKARLDRVLVKLKGWEVERIRRVGMDKVREGVWISDHFGLLTTLKLV